MNKSFEKEIISCVEKLINEGNTINYSIMLTAVELKLKFWYVREVYNSKDIMDYVN